MASDSVGDVVGPVSQPHSLESPRPLDCPGLQSSLFNDYAMGADGPADPMDVAFAYAKDQEVVVFADQTGQAIQAFLVNAGGQTVGELGLLNWGNGWLVGSVDRCSES